MTFQARRTRKVEKLARIYDDEIAPCWGARFARLLLRNLAVPERGQVLDVSCGTGDPAIEILRRMSDGSRLIAIDESSAMLDAARRKVAALGPLGKKVYFRTESAVPRLSFADDVYDLVVCNLGLGDMPSVETALRDFARVAKPGGEVRCTLPLAGTFEEFHDLYREVLVKHDKHDALDRLELHVARYPTYDHTEACLAAAGLTGGIEVEEFSLLFRSAREFFFAPVIEYGPLADWKVVAGGGQEMQDVFWYIKEAIDAYFGARPFHLTVKAGLVVGRKPHRHVVDRTLDTDALTADSITAPVPLVDTDQDSPFDHIETGMPWPPRDIANGSVVEDSGDAEIEELASDEYSLEEESRADQELDALIDGRKRPYHLID
ncbi:MAG TPA: methyltransferase domain-containing protein [Kofleriaceae bacterium]|nr:methyltransferase domain-containing protein [Kofleriaceae bacterium]